MAPTGVAVMSPPVPSMDELPFADESRGQAAPPGSGSPSHADALSASPPPPPPPTDRSSLRFVLNLSCVLLIIFLLVRVLLFEPFGVPTGSMAPAILGHHRCGDCPRCGFPVRVGAPSGGGNPSDHFAHVGCPNCGKRLSLAQARDVSGDRLLVDKHVFTVRPPRRWEMAVFHCPDPDPKEHGKPYVKRVVGLPGESIVIEDGDVYADGVLARKGLAEIWETRELVFDYSYAPEGGWGKRFLVEPRESDPRLPEPVGGGWAVPADRRVATPDALVLDASADSQTHVRLIYRHWNLDEHREDPVRAWISYNGLPRSFASLPLVHDFSLTCEVEVQTWSAGATFFCSLSDGSDTVVAEVPCGRSRAEVTVLSQAGGGILATAPGVSLDPGRSHRIDLSFVDRRILLAIDGREVVAPVDLPPASARGPVSRPFRLAARGCKLLVRRLRLYRDVYYTQDGYNGVRGDAPLPRPAILGPHEYFLLGDNSSHSQDSRLWRYRDATGGERSAAGVPEDRLIGKPFLVHQPLRPVRLTLAGRERFFQTIDWPRLRWLH